MSCELLWKKYQPFITDCLIFRKTQNGDIIFIKSDFVTNFVTKIVPHLKTKFIMITHNSDYSRPEGRQSIQMLDNPLLIKWFVMNPSMAHPKLVPVPIGLENQWFKQAGFFKDLEPWLA